MREATMLARLVIACMRHPCPITPSPMRYATVLLVASEAWLEGKGDPLVWDVFTNVSAWLFGPRRCENTNHVQAYMWSSCR